MLLSHSAEHDMQQRTRAHTRAPQQDSGAKIRTPSILPGFGFTLGFSTFFLTAIVLIPLAALALKSATIGWTDFLRVLLDPRSIASYRLSFGAAFLAATINTIAGFAIAWTLVRYEFPGRKLIDALIDLPFALPTAVSGLALTAIFAPNGWIGQYLEPLGIAVAYTWIGVTVALTLVGMPFVVRSVQPALAEVQRDLEDAAESLGASPFYIFRRIVFPTVLPAVLSGFALAFARGAGEFGSVVFISGNLPYKTEITPLLIWMKLEEFDYDGAAALGMIMLLISFLMLLAINMLQGWGQKRLGTIAKG
jgi:sulfate transport system permease protein